MLRGMRAVTCATALTTALLLAGCGGDDDAPAASEPTTTATTASPEDEVVAVLKAFWAERVRVESSGDYESADYGGILAPSQIEPMLASYSQFGEVNFHRTGSPELRDYTAAISGDSAVATVCVNEDEWGAEADVKIVEADPHGWYPSSHRLEQRDGAWLIVGDAKTPSEISC